MKFNTNNVNKGIIIADILFINVDKNSYFKLYISLHTVLLHILIRLLQYAVSKNVVLCWEYI
jgi:hypothetical protein